MAMTLIRFKFDGGVPGHGNGGGDNDDDGGC